MSCPSKSFIYLDHNATTPLDPVAREAMMPYMAGEFGNPSSGYLLGTRAKQAVETARHEGGAILDGLPRLYASTGAACHDRRVCLSHVLSAMSVPPELGMGALRLTVGRSNSPDQIGETAGMIIARVKTLRVRRP